MMSNKSNLNASSINNFQQIFLDQLVYLYKLFLIELDKHFIILNNSILDENFEENENQPISTALLFLVFLIISFKRVLLKKSLTVSLFNRNQLLHILIKCKCLKILI